MFGKKKKKRQAETQLGMQQKVRTENGKTGREKRRQEQMNRLGTTGFRQLGLVECGKLHSFTRQTRKTHVAKLTFLSTFSRIEINCIPFPIISGGKKNLHGSFISENAEIIHWTTHI